MKITKEELKENQTHKEVASNYEYNPLDSAKILYGVSCMDMDFDFDKEAMVKEIHTMEKAFEKLHNASVGSDEEIFAHHLDVMLMEHAKELSLVNDYLESDKEQERVVKRSGRKR